MMRVAYAGMLLGAGAYPARAQFRATVKVCPEPDGKQRTYTDIHIHKWTHTDDPNEANDDTATIEGNPQLVPGPNSKTKAATWGRRDRRDLHTDKRDPRKGAPKEEGFGGPQVADPDCLEFVVSWQGNNAGIFLWYHWTYQGGTPEPDPQNPGQPKLRSAHGEGQQQQPPAPPPQPPPEEPPPPKPPGAPMGEKQALAQPPPGTALLASVGGLQMATFDTPQGRINVYLPADTSPGDTIWGTVDVEPAGDTEQEKRQNTDTLNGFVVELNNAKTPVGGHLVTTTIAPATTLATTALVLRDRKGAPVGRVEVPLKRPAGAAPTAPPTPADYALPSMGQAGRNIVITGPMLRDIKTTRALVGDQEVKFVAQSPRKYIGELPRGEAGPAQIVFKRGDVEVRRPFRLVAVHLSAVKTTLTPGERTSVTLTAEGLKGIAREVLLQVETQGPVRMKGGNRQTVRIRPGDVKPDGTFTQTRQLTGVRRGVFSVTATLVVPPPGKARKYWSAVSDPANGGETKATVRRVDKSADEIMVWVNDKPTTDFTAERNGTNYEITFGNPLNKGDVVRVAGYVDADKRTPDQKVRLSR